MALSGGIGGAKLALGLEGTLDAEERVKRPEGKSKLNALQIANTKYALTISVKNLKKGAQRTPSPIIDS